MGKDVFSFIIRYLFQPSNDDLSYGNVVFFCFCICLGNIFGSAVSIYLGVGIFYGLYQIFSGNARFPKSHIVLYCAIAFAAFFLAEALTDLFNSGFNSAWEIVENLPFLGVLPLYAVIRARSRFLLDAVETTAAAAALVGFGVLLTGLYGGGYRSELSAGNPGVLAVLAAILLAVNCVGLFRHAGARFFVSGLGAAASAGTLLATGMRGMLLTLFCVPLVTYLCIGSRNSNRPTKRALAVIAVLFVAVGSAYHGPILARLNSAMTDLEAVESADYSGSFGERLLIWKAGYSLFLTSPVTGAGTAASKNTLKELAGSKTVYTHFHNAALNELVRAGLVGLAALAAMFAVPFALCRRRAESETARAGFAILCGMQTSYLISGLTGIMIGHDILDAVFIATTVFAIYLCSEDP
jgi:O-antigen ligase